MFNRYFFFLFSKSVVLLRVCLVALNPSSLLPLLFPAFTANPVPPTSFHSLQNRPSSLTLSNVFPLFMRSFRFQFLFNSRRASLFISSHVHFYLSHSSFPILKMSPRAPVPRFSLTAGSVCVCVCVCACVR
jgi:hypothetical protein